jgi:hypothetical protein
MKKIVLLLSLAPAFWSGAQTFQKCYSREAVVYGEQHSPGYEAYLDQQFELAKQWSQANGPTRSLYTIPVVFHVVHNVPAENLPDSVLINQLQVLNRDYARLNADTSNMRAEFQPVASGTQVRFVLAGIDPDGNPTTGITRTSTATESFGDLNVLFGDFTTLEKVKSTADGGHDPWDQTRYLNIWVCDMSIFGTPALLGYATPPDGLPNWPPGSAPELGDGVVLQYQCVGSNNPNPLGVAGYDVLGRTAVHEVGHYLGLRHIWGDGDCTMDDGIADTPDADAASEQDCDLMKNTCNADVAGLGDLHDMVENFMDYAAETCQNSFTEEQTALMHGVLENQRYDLVHNNPAGLPELTAEVSCYPNPSTGTVNITSSQQMETGKVLLVSESNAAKASLQLSSFQTGIYVLLIRHTNGSVAQQRITVAQ